MGSVLRGLCLAVALCLAGTLASAAALPSTPAAAHPFGDPQTLELALDQDGRTIRAHWKVGMTDDLTWLALGLELLPEDRIMLDGAVTYEAHDAEVLSDNTAFEDYVIRHIGVRTAEGACEGRVTDSHDVAADGATAEFRCPGPVGAATIDVIMLNDLSPDYTTLATGPNGQRFAYNGANPRAEWTFTAATSAANAAAVASLRQIALILGCAAVTAVVVAVVVVRRRRSVRAARQRA